MTELSERLNTPISTVELERRWKAVRAAMTQQKIDVLVMQNNNDHMGGYVKYFTDIPAGNGYPNTVVFPRDDRMTLVTQGPFDGVQKLPPAGDGMRRGVKQVLTTPSYASALYTSAMIRRWRRRRWRCSPRQRSGRVHLSDGICDRRLPQARVPECAVCRRHDMVDAIKRSRARRN